MKISQQQMSLMGDKRHKGCGRPLQEKHLRFLFNQFLLIIRLFLFFLVFLLNFIHRISLFRFSLHITFHHFPHGNIPFYNKSQFNIKNKIKILLFRFVLFCFWGEEEVEVQGFR